VFREIVFTYFSICNSIFSFTARKHFLCISHTVPLLSTLATLHSTETELDKLCAIVGQFRLYSVCQTNLPLSRTSKIERSTFLHLPQFFHHQICYTQNLLLYKALFTPPSSTNVWELIPNMLYQRGGPAQ